MYLLNKLGATDLAISFRPPLNLTKNVAGYLWFYKNSV